jgi:hypothetical protein
MRTPRACLVSSAAALAAILMSGAADQAVAQTPKPPPPKAHAHEHGHAGMSGMMGGPHHAMAMAYRDNLATFARTLRDEVTQSKVVDVDLARPAVAEMRRSFDLIQQRHQAHMAMMGTADSTMRRMMQHMDSAMAAVGKHLTALETEVNGSSPDPGKVIDHATEILKHCDGMSDMHGKKPHQM